MSTERDSLGFATAVAALRDEEVERTRGFLRIGWVIAVGSIAAVLRLHGDRTLAAVLIVAIAATAVASMVAYRALRSNSQYRSRTMTALAVACVVCGALATLYVGYFSAAPMVIALGLYFFCRTEDRIAAIAIYLLTAGSHAAIGILVVAGAIPDLALAPVRDNVSVAAKIVGLLAVQFAYALAYWLARTTRAASLKAIDELQRATRIAALRLAQVDEVRDDLDRALKVGGPGRFTGAVAGNWELGSVLGRGGMGEVYEARHVESGASAAVKLLRRELMIDRKQVERFLREVRVAGTLDSPNVVRVLDASRPEDGVAFLAMERLHGQTLGMMLRDAGTLEREPIVTLVRQLSGALDLARAAELVHRDIKPHNIFLTDDGVWKLLDFGVAVLGESTGTLTEGGVIGTPGYMAPEQAKGDTVDHRADLYALAAVVYRCMTGRVPFTGTELPAILFAMVHEMPVRPSSIAPIPRDIERFFAIALAKRRQDRFQTAAELADALITAADHRLSTPLRQLADALIRQHPWSELDADATRVDPRSREAPTVGRP